MDASPRTLRRAVTTRVLHVTRTYARHRGGVISALSTRVPAASRLSRSAVRRTHVPSAERSCSRLIIPTTPHRRARKTEAARPLVRTDGTGRPRGHTTRTSHVFLGRGQPISTGQPTNRSTDRPTSLHRPPPHIIYPAAPERERDERRELSAFDHTITRVHTGTHTHVRRSPRRVQLIRVNEGDTSVCTTTLHLWRRYVTFH